MRRTGLYESASCLRQSLLKPHPIHRMLALQFTRRVPSVRVALAHKQQQRGYCAPASVSVPIDLIKQLRTKTKAGISDCRAALVEAGLDLTKAEELLQKRAKGVVEKKSSRVAAEGLLAAVTDVTNKKLAVVEVRSHPSLVVTDLVVYQFSAVSRQQ